MDPIILLHGFPLDSGMWRHQAEFLRGKGMTVLTPDLPGFGGAPALAKEHSTIEAFAEQMHELIAREAGGRAIVGGFSMGGYVLLALLRDYPEAVRAAMFIDTRADPDTAEGRAARLKSMDEVKARGPESLFEGMIPRLLSKKPAAGMQEQLRAIMQRQGSTGIMHGQWAMSRRRDQTDLLPELTLPVLIVVGAEDAMTPPSVALAMQTHMPHAMVAQIVSAGHMAPLEQPGSVNSALETFLGTVHEAAREGVPV